jgi:hypothetical protein
MMDVISYGADIAILGTIIVFIGVVVLRLRYYENLGPESEDLFFRHSSSDKRASKVKVTGRLAYCYDPVDNNDQLITEKVEFISNCLAKQLIAKIKSKDLVFSMQYINSAIEAISIEMSCKITIDIDNLKHLRNVYKLEGKKLIPVDSDNTTTECHDIICSICREDYQDGDTVRLLGCNHYFHKNCIDSWLSTNDSCPYCRQDVI